MKKIAVFGANGFIGKNVVESLSNKYFLLTPTRNEVDLTQEAKVDRFFKSNRVDIVINCAVVGGSRKEEYQTNMLDENLRMFFNLARNKKYFGKLIHLGSGAEYDKGKTLKKVNENDFDKAVPKDGYGFYKYICSKYIENAENIVNLRIFGLFGKYEDYRFRFISNAICRNIFGMPILINQDVYFDYLYIDDFVKILEYFIKNNTKQKFYNIGTGKPVNLSKIANIINKISLFKSDIIIKTKGLGNEYTCDNSLLIKEVGQVKLTSLIESIQDLLSWYKDNKNLIDPNLI